MERREVIDRLLTRLPNFCERLSLFEFEQASECMLPEIRQQWTSKQLSEIWTNVASPLLLFAGCERLYMIMDYLEDNNLGNMLAQVAIDLEKVRAYLTHGDPEEQPVPTDRIRPARSGGAHRMTGAARNGRERGRYAIEILGVLAGVVLAAVPLQIGALDSIFGDAATTIDRGSDDITFPNMGTNVQVKQREIDERGRSRRMYTSAA